MARRVMGNKKPGNGFMCRIPVSCCMAGGQTCPMIFLNKFFMFTSRSMRSWRRSMGTRSCCMVSRWRMVTQLSVSVSWSTVMQVFAGSPAPRAEAHEGVARSLAVVEEGVYEHCAGVRVVVRVAAFWPRRCCPFVCRTSRRSRRGLLPAGCRVLGRGCPARFL